MMHITAQHYSANALRFYALAVRYLQWTPPDFWAATPAEFHAALAPLGQSTTHVDGAHLRAMMEQDHHDRSD